MGRTRRRGWARRASRLFSQMPVTPVSSSQRTLLDPSKLPPAGPVASGAERAATSTDPVPGHASPATSDPARSRATAAGMGCWLRDVDGNEVDDEGGRDGGGLLQCGFGIIIRRVISRTPRYLSLSLSLSPPSEAAREDRRAISISMYDEFNRYQFRGLILQRRSVPFFSLNPNFPDLTSFSSVSGDSVASCSSSCPFCIHEKQITCDRYV